MDLQFHETTCPCLQQIKWEVQNQEQTQEVRLPDGMPDIGRVLACWGQVLMRSKEWHSNEMKISGGVMAWVLYKPEEGDEPQSAQTWIPFQMKWDLPPTERDGVISAACLLRGVDARSISARKLMVRANVGILAEAMVQTNAAMYYPQEMPDDVQILKRGYPMRLPKEAGEKIFQIEEEVSLPASESKVEQILRCSLLPEILEKKVMAGRVVFRGTANLQMLYRGDDGRLHSWEYAFPFSQFTDLTHEYDPDATVRILPAVTGLEVDPLEDGQIRIKCSLTGQYVVYDRQVIEVVEDAYSPVRTVMPNLESLGVPMILEEQTQLLPAEQTVQMEVQQVVDAVFYPDHAHLMGQPEGKDVEVSGVFQLLAYDREGNLQSDVSRWEGMQSVPAGVDSALNVTVHPGGKPQITVGSDSVMLRGEVPLDMVTLGQQGIPMVTALQLGEEKAPDPDRPSLILRRAGGDTLWDMAKSCGSTVDAICRINSLEGEPEHNRMLLIPIS